MESVGITVLADVFFVCSKILAQSVHIRQCIHLVLLEHIVHFPQIRPQFIVEIAVTDRSTNNHAVIAHDPLMADHLCGKRLHHHDRIRPHAFTIVEKLRHAEYHHIIFLLRKGYISPLVSHFP